MFLDFWFWTFLGVKGLSFLRNPRHIGEWQAVFSENSTTIHPI